MVHSRWDHAVLWGAPLSAVVLTIGLVLLGVSTGLMLIICAVVVPVLWIVPLRHMPSVGLAAFALVPVYYLPIPTINGGISPALVVLVVYALRAMRGSTLLSGGWTGWALSVSCVWMALSTVYSTEWSASLLWLINFVFLVAIPLLAAPSIEGTAHSLRRTWIGLSGVLGLFALVEFALRENPIFGSFYASGVTPLNVGSDVYRITTTLGHPLVNGAFFAMGSILAMHYALTRRSRTATVALATSVSGLILTFSRTSVAAGLAGLVLVTGIVLAATRFERVNKKVLIGSCLAVLIVFPVATTLLAERWGSAEARGSTVTRLLTIEAGVTLAERFEPLGAGPGRSDAVKRDLGIGDPRRGIESSWIQVWVSLGSVGALVLALVVVTAVFSGFARSPDAAVALIVYASVIATFNLIEAHRPALLLLGVLLVLCVDRSQKESDLGRVDSGTNFLKGILENR